MKHQEEHLHNYGGRKILQAECGGTADLDSLHRRHPVMPASGFRYCYCYYYYYYD